MFLEKTKKIFGVCLMFVLFFGLVWVIPEAWDFYKTKTDTSSVQTESKKKCELSDIEVTHIKAGFVDKKYVGHQLQGAATIINHCHKAVGVKINLVAFDSAGTAQQVQGSWPASTANILPGEYSFKLWGIDYDPQITSFKVIPIQVKEW